MNYLFETDDFGNVHPKHVLIEAKSRLGRNVSVLGSSIGGGNIEISRINGIRVEFTGRYHTLVFEHKDVPGIVSSVTSRLAEEGINIACMRLYKKAREVKPI